MMFLVPVLIYSCCFLLLFAIAELLYSKLKVRAEYTRKLVHVCTGLLTLGFPVFFDSIWQVVIICFMFLGLLLLSLKFNFLQSINKVDRKTYGSILYPVIVIIVFAFFQYNKSDESEVALVNFYIPVLIMAVSDPIAAIAGNWYTRNDKHQGKTFVGSFSFFVSAFILSFCVLEYFSQNSLSEVVLVSLALSLLTAVVERISKKGWDNFTVPLMAMAVLFVNNLLK